jgi:nucleoside-diphosphate-sugar epimerase
VHVIVAGFGWLGARLARELMSRGDRVTAVRRTPVAAVESLPYGVVPVSADLADPRGLAGLPERVDAIVACQAAGSGSVDAYRSAYVEGNRNLLDYARRSGARAYVYTSSTGVFGYSDGRTVDERTPVAPADETAAVLAEAEELVLGGATARIVRLSGLYGPGRTGVIDRVASGSLSLGPGDETWMNFCHLEDAVRTVVAAVDRGEAGATYHATDAFPAARKEVVLWIASRLRISPPRAEESADRPPGDRRRANRRIIGETTRSLLGIELAFPSFREGLAPHFAAASADS